MDLLNVDRLDICPWALREGLILRRLDLLDPDEEPNRPAKDRRTWPGPARGLQEPTTTAGVPVTWTSPGVRPGRAPE